jgi:hypothetical protein
VWFAKNFTPKHGSTWRISTSTRAFIVGRRRKPTSSNIFASLDAPGGLDIRSLRKLNALSHILQSKSGTA